MAEGTIQRRSADTIAKGARRGKGSRKGNMIRIMTPFDEDTWDEIQALAIKTNTSCAEAIRTLVTWGLESAE